MYSWKLIVGGIVILWITLKILSIPVDKIVSLLISSVFGAGKIIIFNYIGSFIGLNIKLSIINALLVGYLGIPGLAVLLIFQLSEFQFLGSIIRNIWTNIIGTIEALIF